MSETSFAPEILSTHADQCGRRRKYLSSDSICWTIYNTEFRQENNLHPENSSAEGIRQRLLEVSTRLLDLPSDLCCICRCIDFEYYYSGFPSARNLIISRVTPLGLVQNMDSDCSLCQLMIYSSKKRASMACFLCFEQQWNRKPRLKLSFYELTSSLTPAEAFSLSPNANHNDSEPHEERRVIPSISLIKIGDDSTWITRQRPLANGRVVAPTIDFRLLRKFLEAADQETWRSSWKRRILTSNLGSLIQMLAELPSLVNSAVQDPTVVISRSKNGAMDNYNMLWKLSANFRVIDLHRCGLVNPAPSVRFVALSYVWGKLTRPHLVNTKANCSNLYLPKAISPLSEALPRTVRDAMVATTGLGYRYLWVDALCIVQDDNGEKRDQINRMAAVYRLASLTIVAAAGNDADAGLPGVCPTRRPQWQYVFGNGSARFANRGGDLEESIWSSYWMTRGWTYQEFALSSRLLIFTAYQAFAVDARRGDSLDSSYLYQSESDVSRLLQRGSIAVSFTGHIASKPLDALGLYRNAIGAYSIRQLTFQGDILNAFEGIASYLNLGLRGGFTFGLPNTFLEYGLLWAAYPPNPREPGLRKGFPEYSWASRDHKVSMLGRPSSTWPSSRILWRNFSPQRTKEWLCEDDIMPQARSEEATKWRFWPEGSVIKVVSGSKPLSVTQPYWQDTEEYPSWQHARPILPTRLLPSFQPAEPSTGHLHFWSYVIRLALQRAGTEDLAWVPLNEQLLEEDGVSHSNRIGEFHMDSTTFPNPTDLALLCCFEGHNRLSYFEPSARPQHHEVDRNLPWHVSKFLRDAARANPIPETMGLSPWAIDTAYAVLAVETIDGISYRRGVGTVDPSWFHKANPEAKYIRSRIGSAPGRSELPWLIEI
jgi:Heterokaryon incompatibility protein (HET)